MRSLVGYLDLLLGIAYEPLRPLTSLHEPLGAAARLLREVAILEGMLFPGQLANEAATLAAALEEVDDTACSWREDAARTLRDAARHLRSLQFTAGLPLHPHACDRSAMLAHALGAIDADLTVYVLDPRTPRRSALLANAMPGAWANFVFAGLAQRRQPPSPSLRYVAGGLQ
jgi:hypothetical protein